MVLELLHPGFGLFALLTAALLRGRLLLALLLRGGAHGLSSRVQMLYTEMIFDIAILKKVLTFTSVGPGFEGAAVVSGCTGVTAGRLAGGSLVAINFTKSVVGCAATGKA